MKNFKFVFAILFACFAFSCSDFKVHESLKDKIVYSTKYKNGGGEEQKINFLISREVYESVNNEDKLKEIIRESLFIAKIKAKYKLTYEFLDDYTNLVMIDDGEIIVEVNGSAKNAFGVRCEITTVSYYTSQGDPKFNKDFSRKYTTW